MIKMYAKIFAMLVMVLSFSGSAFAQEIEITGTVLDAKDGAGIPGVNVLRVGTTTGTTTDINGAFRIKAVPGDKLEFRLLGYTTVRRDVSAETVVNVQMQEEAKNLQEAVVIGYGQVRKKDLTGSLTNITSKDFQTGQNTTPEALIAGKVAGVQITNNGGGPGSGSVIRIRGAASLNASNDPLIIIDGVPVDNGGISGSPNPLSLINPADIESFTVLKDASATAIYGSRASNGVILITTKKGNVNQKKTLTVTSNHSVAQPFRFVDVLSGDQFRAMIKQYGTKAQKALIDTNGITNTDWQKEIYQLAYTQDHNASFTGNLKIKEGYNLPYRISGGFLSQNGILKRDRMDRYTAGLNLSPVFFNGDLKVNLNLKLARSTHFFANRGAIGAAVVYDPTRTVYQEGRNESSPFGGFTEWANPTTNQPIALAPANPVGLLASRDDRTYVNRLIGNVQLDYALPFLKDLRANLNLGTDRSLGLGTVRVDSVFFSDFNRRGRRNESRQEKQNNLLEFTLNYAKEIASIKSRVDAVAGYGYQDFLTTNYAFADFRYNGDTMPNSKPLFPFDKPQNRLISYFGRVNYVFAEKFLLTATLRTDGSSRFAEDVRWGVFPSFASAYTLSEEKFIKKIKWVNLIKIRYGYGVTGQQEIGNNYAFLGSYRLTNQFAQYQLGNDFVLGYRPSPYDARIRWESTATQNVALDFSLFGERLNGSVDVYNKQTSNLLLTRPVAAGVNFSDYVFTNVGNMENRGIEINLSGAVIKKTDLTWNIGGNLTVNRNQITRLSIDSDTTDPSIKTGGIEGGVGSTIQMQTVGQPINSFLVYRQVYRDGKPVEGLFEDLNNDGRINDKDLYIYKQPAPLAFIGFTTSVEWKKLTAGMVWRASLGNYVYNNIHSDKGNRNFAFLQSNYVSNVSADYLETNFSGRPQNGATTDQARLSDHFVQNASFLRCDNLYLSYNFGEIAPKFSLALNFNVQNAFLITKYRGIDPEIFNGIDNNFYPRPRTFTIGLTGNFLP